MSNGTLTAMCLAIAGFSLLGYLILSRRIKALSRRLDLEWPPQPVRVPPAKAGQPISVAELLDRQGRLQRTSSTPPTPNTPTPDPHRTPRNPRPHATQHYPPPRQPTGTDRPRTWFQPATHLGPGQGT